MIAVLTRYAICSLSMGILAGLLLLLLPRLSKYASARSLYLALALVMVGFIIPWRPTLPGPTVTTYVQAPTVIQGMGISVPLSATNALPATPANVVSTPSASVNLFPAILCSLWVAGVALTLGRQLWKHHRFIRTVRRWSEPVTDPIILGAYKEAHSALGISRSVSLHTSPSIASPMLIGFVRPVILLPVSQMDADTLPLILRHELIHHKRGDLYSRVLSLLATALHWFNPVVYLVSNAMTLQCEIACDATVLEGTDRALRERYGAAIIGVACRQSAYRTALSTTFNGGKNDMKQRILSLLDMRRKRLGALLLCLVLTMTMLAGAAFATKEETIRGYPLDVQRMIDQFAPYADFGLTYDPDANDLLYEGETVRLFEDADGSHGNANGFGGIDVYATYDEGGAITDIKPHEDKNDPTRTALWARLTGSNVTTSSSDLIDPDTLTHYYPQGAIDALERYMYCWHNNKYDEMVKYTLPAWLAKQDSPEQQLYWSHNWWNLDGFGITDAKVLINSVTFRVEALMSKSNAGLSPVTMEYNIVVSKDGDGWYVDPESTRNSIELAKYHMISSDPYLYRIDYGTPMTQAVDVVSSAPPIITDARDGWTEIFKEYESLGLVYYQDDDSLTYNGQPVRYFTDVRSSNGEPLGSNGFAGQMTLFSSQGGGEIDVGTVRDEQGMLVCLEVATEEAFGARQYAWPPN